MIHPDVSGNILGRPDLHVDVRDLFATIVKYRTSRISGADVCLRYLDLRPTSAVYAIYDTVFYSVSPSGWMACRYSLNYMLGILTVGC